MEPITIFRFLWLRQGRVKTEVSKLPKMILEQSEIAREVSKTKTKTQKRST